MGLEKLYRITNQPYIKYSIRVEMTLKSGGSHYYQTDNFYIAGESELYKIVSIGSVIATTVNRNYFFKTGLIFATFDKDLKEHFGRTTNGFWYISGQWSYVRFNKKEPHWTSVSTGPVDHTEIKIRPLTA